MSDEQQKATLGMGNVPVTIDGEQMELVPSYAAMVKVSSLNGGLRGALEKVLQLDASTIIEVLVAGLGYGAQRRPPKDLHERIWRTGFLLTSGGLADAAFNYINILANGGRPLPEAGDDSDDDSGEARQDPADPRKAPREPAPPQ